MITRIFFLLAFGAIWLGLAGVHSEAQLIIFAIFAPFVAFVFGRKLGVIPSKNFFKLSSVLYFLWLLKEITLSSMAVVKISWRKNLRIRPALETIKTIQKNDVGLTTYANSITMTPGTVTLSTEEGVLLVHALDQCFMDDLQEGEMDRRVLEIIK